MRCEKAEWFNINGAVHQRAMLNEGFMDFRQFDGKQTNKQTAEDSGRPAGHERGFYLSRNSFMEINHGICRPLER